MRRCVLTLLAVLAWPLTANAAPEPEPERQCAEVAAQVVPAEDLPGPAVASCSSMEHYYGLGRPVDPVRARHCAVLEARSPDEPAIGGRAVLMMLYANGRGVRRNLDLAVKLACELEQAPAEKQGRVAHLAQLRDAGWQGDDFDVCDDITSGFMGGMCARVGYQRDEAERARRLDALIRAWSPEHRAALAALRTANDAFIEARVRHEVDASGTLRGAFALEEREDREEAFVAAMESFAHRRLPSSTETEHDRLDHELNRVYRALRRDPTWRLGTIEPDGIQATQRAWLELREAWVEFGAVVHPTVTPTSWRAWATQRRVAMLREFVD